MNSTTSAKTITVLREMFARYGIPRTVVSDNGPQFVSEEFQQFMGLNSVKHIRTRPTLQPATVLQKDWYRQLSRPCVLVSRQDFP